MARKESFDKDYILKKASEYVDEYGIYDLNVRSLTKYIGCSTQPIFRLFSNMDLFKKDLKKYLHDEYEIFINQYIDKDNYLYTISYAYALFASYKPNIFHALFITSLSGSRTIKDVINSSWNRDTIIALSKQYNISLEAAEEVYRDVRFYTHGIATQLCCKSIVLSDEEIGNLINNIINKVL